MGSDETMTTYIPIGKCEICSALDEVETSFTKYGWEDMDRALQLAAARKACCVASISSHNAIIHSTRMNTDFTDKNREKSV